VYKKFQQSKVFRKIYYYYFTHLYYNEAQHIKEITVFSIQTTIGYPRLNNNLGPFHSLHKKVHRISD